MRLSWAILGLTAKAQDSDLCSYHPCQNGCSCENVDASINWSNSPNYICHNKFPKSHLGRNCEYKELNLDCGVENISLRVNNDAVAGEHAKSVFMGAVENEDCLFSAPGTLNGDHGFSMPVGTGCGTRSSVEITGSGDMKVGKLVYSNQIILGNPASYGNDKILPLFTQNAFLAKWKCKYVLAVDPVEFMDLINPISDLHPIGLKGSSEIQTTMDVFTLGPQFTGRTAVSGPHVSPVSVGVNKVGAKSWIVVKTVAADPAVRIQLDSCAAVTFPNAQGDPKYDEIQLIEKGCPVSPLVEIISMGSSAAAEFSIRSFQWKNGVDAYLVKCSVSFCRAGQCKTPNSCSRRRRSATRRRFMTKQNTIFNGPFYTINVAETEYKIDESIVENN